MGFPGKRRRDPKVGGRWNVARSKPESKPVASKALQRPQPRHAERKQKGNRNIEPAPEQPATMPTEGRHSVEDLRDRAVCCARNGASATRTSQTVQHSHIDPRAHQHRAEASIRCDTPNRIFAGERKDRTRHTNGTWSRCPSATRPAEVVRGVSNDPTWYRSILHTACLTWCCSRTPPAVSSTA